MQRPSSARTTQTKNYFDSRDAKNDESTEISPPFLQTNDENITQRYLYRKGENGSAISSVDDVLFDVHEWNLTRTVKPKDQFVDDMKLCITGIRIVDEYLIGQLTAGESGSLDNEPKTEVKSLFARISRYWWSFCCRITEFITTCFTCHNRFQMDGVNTSGESKRNADLMAGEDGIFVSPIHANPITKASHLSRVEARMRRELSLASNATKNDTTREGPNEQADVPDNNVNSDHFNESTETSCAEPDESYCLSPEDQRSTNRNCRHQQVEVTIQVDQVKFSSHPGFNAEEKALSQISDLYGKYQAQIESKPFHYFVTRLIAILRYYMRTIHAERSEEETFCHSVSSALVLNDDLKTTTRNLVKTLDSVQYFSSRIKEKWGALLSARESAGFACTDAALENINVPNAELANDVGRLTDEIASIRPKLTAIYNDVTNDSLSYLEEVERKISDASCLFEVLKLTRSKNSQLGWIPREEKLRRRKISSEKYFARLIVNGHSVGDTHAEQLDWPSFSIRLGHRFRCNLSEQPNDVCIQIWMLSTGFMPAKNISTCYIRIPEKVIVAYHKAKLKSTTPILPVPTVEWYQFSSEKCFGECRGAALIAVRNCVRYENCLIPATRSAKMSRHSFTFVGHSKKLMRSSLDHRGFVKRQSAEKPNLSNSIQQKMNDNSSQNAHIFNCFIPILQYGMSFKLLSTSSFFYNKSLLEEPTRHALIKKRQTNANIPSPIPIDELLVQDSERHHSLIRNDAETTLGETIDVAIKERTMVNRRTVIEFFRSIQEHSIVKDKQRRKIKSHFSEVVQDPSIFRFEDDEGGFELWFPKRKRSLFPIVTRRLPTIHQANKYALLLTVVCGKSFPLRMEGDNKNTPSTNPGLEELGSNADSGVGIITPSTSTREEEYLGVNVKIKFRGKFYKTKVANGSTSPCWKETVAVPLDAIIEKVFDVSSSTFENEVVQVFVFDAIANDVRNVGGFYDDENTKLSENRYLGSVSIPLMSVLSSGQIDGFVKLCTPDIILGYTKGSRFHTNLVGTNEEEDGDKEEIMRRISIMEPERRRQARSNTMLRVFATTEPYACFPKKGRTEYPSNETAFVLTRVKQWAQSHLNFGAMVHCCPVLWPDNRGVSWLATRFLTEQNPPNGFDTLTSCAHYVSLIPSLDEWRALTKATKKDAMVLTSQQCINIHAGNREERSALLANFFMHLSKKSPVEHGADVFLAIGLGVPEGATVYVLRRCKVKGEITFWDASTACDYSQDDDSCPLQKIYCVVSKENIYANLENEKRTFFLDFDLSNTRKWAPLFVDAHGHSSMTLMPIQEERLHFAPTNHRSSRELQDELKEATKTAIRGWRRGATSFRSDVGSKLTLILDKLEDSRMKGNSIALRNFNLPESVTKTRSVFGFPLHFAFTKIDEILDMIETTEIHGNMNPQVEFALGVRVFTYPGGLLSVWVFICSLVPIV